MSWQDRPALLWSHLEQKWKRTSPLARLATILLVTFLAVFFLHLNLHGTELVVAWGPSSLLPSLSLSTPGNGSDSRQSIRLWQSPQDSAWAWGLLAAWPSDSWPSTDIGVEAQAEKAPTAGSQNVQEPLDFMAPMPPGGVPRDAYTAICSIVRLQSEREHAQLREWVLHHVYYFGTKMFIYDHESTPPLAPVLADYVERGDVEVIEFVWPQKKIPQMTAYGQCLGLTKEKHTFVGFFDWDEFLWLSPYWKSQPLRKFLEQFEERGALAVNWVTHGSSGFVKAPQGIRRSYTKCSDGRESSNHVKSFVRPELAQPGPNPHFFKLTPPHGTSDELFRRVSGHRTVSYSVANISLHHFALKSKEDFQRKFNRGSPYSTPKNWGYFDAVDVLCNETCLELARLPV